MVHAKVQRKRTTELKNKKKHAFIENGKLEYR